MRFPIDPLPPIGSTENPYEIREKSPITPVKAVMPHGQALVFQHRPRRAPETPVQRRAGEERREHEDRRQGDRRRYTQKVLIDTRSGHERRHERRRPDDPLTGVDEKV